jgi:hypothetical protein
MKLGVTDQESEMGNQKLLVPSNYFAPKHYSDCLAQS